MLLPTGSPIVCVLPLIALVFREESMKIRVAVSGPCILCVRENPWRIRVAVSGPCVPCVHKESNLMSGLVVNTQN